MAHLLALCPPTPPSNDCQGPPLPNRCMDEPVLRSATPETVSCEIFHKARSLTEFCKEALHLVVGEGFLWMEDAVWCDVRKDVVIVFNLSPDLLFKKGHPHRKSREHVELTQILLVDMVRVAFYIQR